MEGKSFIFDRDRFEVRDSESKNERFTCRITHITEALFEVGGKAIIL